MPPPLEYWEEEAPVRQISASDVDNSDDFEGLLEEVRESDNDDETWTQVKPAQSRLGGSQSRQVSPISSGSNALFDEDGIFVGALCDDSEAPDPATSLSVRVPFSTLVTPQSRFDGFQPLAPEASEQAAVKNLIQGLSPDSDGNFELELDQFVVYRLTLGDETRPYKKQAYPYELKSLHTFSIQGAGPAVLYADGYLSNGESKYFVRKMEFWAVPIGNYGLDSHTVGDQVWIQTRLYERGGSPAYFKLKNPAQEYSRYYVGFRWIADLAKHVVDYLAYMETMEHKPVEFHHFRAHFYHWLLRTHGQDAAFQRWFRQYGKEDFRITVHANKHFIYKEAHGILSHEGTHFHPLWTEIKDFTAYTASGLTRPDRGKNATATTIVHNPKPDGLIPRTVVTSYIYDCFSHLPFGFMMEKVEPSTRTDELRRALIRQQHLEMPSQLHDSPKQMKSDSPGSARSMQTIRVGSVISTHRDTDGGHWDRQEAVGFDDVDRWFGLVQSIHTSKTDARSFDVIWIYRPVDTICGAMKYPWNNELFLSDHCTCGGGMAKIKEAEVLGIHRVHWGGSSTTNAEFFCRQTYLHEERRWITWERAHLACSHHKAQTPLSAKCTYVKGDTVLARINLATEFLEPCVLLDCGPTQSQLVVLPRRGEIDTTANYMPNELVWSDSTQPIVLSNSRIQGRCLVRHFDTDEEVSMPYNRAGVGNAFFIRTRVLQRVGLPARFVSFSDEYPFPPGLRQGMDPKDTFRKLKGFDLFCGGGNFGRGLEESGAIEMRWANDINSRAIHTYMANLDGDQKSKVHPFLGSIDDLQRRALQGDFADNVPPIGEVEFVSGGSPCPGFSRLTADKTTPEQRKNQSLVAAFGSFIDLYRPKYGLLENVVEIVQSKKSRTQDVFSQLICAIVGLGYQAHFFLLDAWVYGSPQSRSRVFLAFAAPGHRLPEMPMPSHLYLESDRKNKSLGWLPNGEPMAKRLLLPSAFKPVTASAALADLPDIGDGKPDACIAFPDHRHCYGVTRAVRTQFSIIPTRPYEMSFAKAYFKSRVMTEAEREAFPADGLRVSQISRGWTRVHPQRIMSTITTSPSPTDAFVGNFMHWNQPRILTIMEARRAQGFRDHEVILGDPKEQWATIGNSVAREVSVALGISFREAWLGSLVKGDETLHAEASLMVGKMAVTIDEDELAEDWADRFVTHEGLLPKYTQMSRPQIAKAKTVGSYNGDDTSQLRVKRRYSNLTTTYAVEFTETTIKRVRVEEDAGF